MTTLAVDNFNRTNSSTLGTSGDTPSATWVEDDGNLQIVSNELTEVSPAVNSAYESSRTWPNNQWAEVRIGTAGTISDSGQGPSVRNQSTGPGTNGNMYFAQGNTTETKLYKRVSNVYTQIPPAPGGDGPAIAAGDVLRLEVTGTSLTVMKNGSTIIGPVTDTALASGKAAVWCADAGTIDMWQAGDFAAAAEVYPAVNPAARGMTSAVSRSSSW